MIWEAYRSLIVGVKRDDSMTVVVSIGQFILLHGVRTIMDAVRLTSKEPIQLVLIRKRQNQRLVEPAAREQLNRLTLNPYRELIGWIHKADICIRLFLRQKSQLALSPTRYSRFLAGGHPSLDFKVVP